MWTGINYKAKTCSHFRCSEESTVAYQAWGILSGDLGILAFWNISSSFKVISESSH